MSTIRVCLGEFHLQNPKAPDTESMTSFLITTSCMYSPVASIQSQATAVMLEFERSLLRQSKPSTLTAAGLRPNFPLAHPPLRANGESVGDVGDGNDNGDEGEPFFTPRKRESKTNGLETLDGGDPEKNGGDDGAPVIDFSAALAS
ncbi:hypothetical protein Droror1_Dr00016118 [Drosera rotundifolia]